MKRKIGVLLGAIMVLVILYNTVSSSGIIDAIMRKATNKTGTAPEEQSSVDKSTLTEFEINAMESTCAEKIVYMGETTKSCGYSIKANSYNLFHEKRGISGIEGFSDYYKEYYGEGDDKVILTVDVEIENENVEENFEQLYKDGLKFDLCLGNIFAKTFDKSGKSEESKGLFVCTNDKENIRAKNSWIYPLERGEKYKGKLVYVFDEDAFSNAKIGIVVNLMSNNVDTKENRLILLN